MERSETVRQLGDSALFANLDQESLELLADQMQAVSLNSGETLLEEGDEGDSVFVVVTGRLRAFVTGASGHEIAVGEIGAGEVVGEMALLSAAPRSATIRAVRDSQLLELPSAGFSAHVLDHPETLIAVTRLLVERLQRSIHRTELGRRIRVVAVVPANSSTLHQTFAHQLQTVFEATRRADLVDRPRLIREIGEGSTEADVAHLLHQMETHNDIVLLVGDEPLSEWTHQCARQADLILLTADGRTHPPGPHDERFQLTTAGATRPGLRLILTHVGPELPTGTAQWLRAFRPDRHHHVRTDDPSSLQRLGRILTGESTGLVFGGGGARGFAHLGVLKALLEAGVPIDHVGGASSGATMAGTLALGLNWDQCYAASRRATVDNGSLVDFTFPAVALSRGGKVTSGIRDAYGDTDIEDAWLDFFCVSSDLSAGRLLVHTEGPLWRAVRASVSIPGTFPPVISADGNVLVDGGIMNNLPVNVMRDVYNPGRVLAVDLRAGTNIPARDLDDSGTVSGWKVAARRLNPFAPRMQVPRIIDVLLRSTEIASGEQEVDADVLFRPPVEEFGILDFKRHREIIDAGYRYAVKAIEEAEEALV